jgi:SAM-dependent methyltransferase
MMAKSGYEKCAHLYDLFDTKENIEFFLRYASEAGEVLDVGAGTGRIAVPLAEKGVKVFCVEPSPAMRREFHKKLSARPGLSKNIELVAGDATSFKFPRTFPAAFLSGVFDHFLDDEERSTALRNIAKHLEERGKFVFEVGLGYMKESPMSPAGKITEGDKEYRRFLEGKVLPNDKVEWLLVYEIYQSGKLTEKIEERSCAGIVDRAKVHRLLKETGFEITKEFGGHDFKEYEEGDDLLVIEAEKL